MAAFSRSWKVSMVVVLDTTKSTSSWLSVPWMKRSSCRPSWFVSASSGTSSGAGSLSADTKTGRVVLAVHVARVGDLHLHALAGGQRARQGERRRSAGTGSLVPAPMCVSSTVTGPAHWLEMSVRRGMAGQS